MSKASTLTHHDMYALLPDKETLPITVPGDIAKLMRGIDALYTSGSDNYRGRTLCHCTLGSCCTLLSMGDDYRNCTYCQQEGRSRDLESGGRVSSLNCRFGMGSLKFGNSPFARSFYYVSSLLFLFIAARVCRGA